MNQIKFLINQTGFISIPGYPIAYWVSNAFLNAFSNHRLGEFCDLSEGIHSRDNDSFLRLWFEVGFNNSSLISFDGMKKWFPCNKGGKYRKWYGNNEYVIDWENDGKHIKENPKSSIGSECHHFEEGITFTTITSSERTFRYSPHGFLYDMAGPTLFMDDSSWTYYVLAVFSSKLGYHFLSAINPGISLKLGEVKNFPMVLNICRKEDITKLSKENVDICRYEWDAFETSWDFRRHPLI